MHLIINKHFTKDTEDYRKALLFAWMLTIVFVMCIIFAIIDSFVPIYLNVSFAPFYLTTFSLLVMLYATGKLGLCVDIACISVLLALIKPLLVTGCVTSQLYIWLILSPVCALTIGNSKKAIIWSFFTILTQVFIYTQDTTPLKQIEKFNILLNNIFFASIVLIIMLSYENIKVRQQNTIQEQLRILLEQKKLNLEIIEQLQNTEYALNTSNKELKSFVFGASHDLKELLRMVSMHVQVLRKKLSNYIDDTTEQHIGFVVSGVKNMEELLRKLISHEQIGDNLTTKSKVNLNEICYFAIKEVNAKINNITIQTHVDDLPSLYTHEREIAHLFRNLIDNALKFRKDDVVPSLSITYTEDETEYLFKITDNGLGVKTEYQASVFDLFFRLNNRRDYEGSGIGLATCKKIVILMGGRIWLESKEQEGTTIFFTANKSMVK